MLFLLLFLLFVWIRFDAKYGYFLLLQNGQIITDENDNFNECYKQTHKIIHYKSWPVHVSVMLNHLDKYDTFILLVFILSLSRKTI